eukprot:scaffold880_cov132-Cylindrotheca_fusiformis.AAC.63
MELKEDHASPPPFYVFRRASLLASNQAHCRVNIRLVFGMYGSICSPTAPSPTSVNLGLDDPHSTTF